MDREEAHAVVGPYIKPFKQYRVVTAGDALKLLGEEGYQRLLNDKIRSLGPSTATHYYWNIVDHLQMYY